MTFNSQKRTSPRRIAHPGFMWWEDPPLFMLCTNCRCTGGGIIISNKSRKILVQGWSPIQYDKKQPLGLSYFCLTLLNTAANQIAPRTLGSLPRVRKGNSLKILAKGDPLIQDDCDLWFKRNETNCNHPGWEDPGYVDPPYTAWKRGSNISFLLNHKSQSSWMRGSRLG